MPRLIMAGMIGVIVVIGMTLRMLAFQRADSFAVEMGKASLLTYIFKIVYEWQSIDFFLEHNLVRLLVLTGLAYLTCYFHHQFCLLCFDSIRKKLDIEKENMKALSEHGELPAEGEYLDAIAIIAERSLYLSYSRHYDRTARNNTILRMLFMKNQTADAGFKPKKTELRRSLAKVTNYIIEMAVGGNRNSNEIFQESDFNIPEKAQKIGITCFQVLPVLTIIIALEFI